MNLGITANIVHSKDAVHLDEILKVMIEDLDRNTLTSLLYVDSIETLSTEEYQRVVEEQSIENYVDNLSYEEITLQLLNRGDQ